MAKCNTLILLNKYFMEYFILGFIWLVMAVLQCYLNLHFKKKIDWAVDKIFDLSVARTMDSIELHEFISEHLLNKAKGEELTGTEKNQFQKSRFITNELDKRLKEAGFYKKSSL